MNNRLSILFLAVTTFLWAGCGTSESTTEVTDETPAQAASQTNSTNEGEWVVLFDGESLDAWQDYNGEGVSWKVEDGAMTTDGGIGDIMTKETFGNFELEFDWKISEAGNSGVLYLVQDGDQYEHAHETGPEYQIIDADNFTEKNDYPLEDNQKTAANYALHTADGAEMKPIDEYNQGKIIVNDGHVEHWLNGQKVVEYDLWTDEWKQQVAATKFKDMPGYGASKEGHIAFQDHQDRVWFRNVRVKRL